MVHRCQTEGNFKINPRNFISYKSFARELLQKERKTQIAPSHGLCQSHDTESHDPIPLL